MCSSSSTQSQRYGFRPKLQKAAHLWCRITAEVVLPSGQCLHPLLPSLNAEPDTLACCSCLPGQSTWICAAQQCIPLMCCFHPLILLMVFATLAGTDTLAGVMRNSEQVCTCVFSLTNVASLFSSSSCLALALASRSRTDCSVFTTSCEAVLLSAPTLWMFC